MVKRSHITVNVEGLNQVGMIHGIHSKGGVIRRIQSLRQDEFIA